VWRTRTRRAGTRCLCAAALAACPLAASAQRLALSLEPGVALAAQGASAHGLRLPSGASLKALLGLGRYLDVSIGVGFVGLPDLSDSTSPMSGMASTVGVGLRLKRPHDQRSFLGVSPWVDAEALSVHGRAGDRRALAMGAGLAFPIGRERSIWLGPFVRYLQMLEPSGARLDKHASDGLFAGATFEVGSGVVAR
jgi:hypothetical protein